MHEEEKIAWQKTVALNTARDFPVIERIDEKRGKDEIILTVYQTHADSEEYTYSLQARIAAIIRAIFPHQIRSTYPTPTAAKRAAIETLCQWAKGRAAKERLALFDITASPYQLEFDFG